MAKSDRQTITLMAIVNGVFLTIESWELEPKLLPTIEWGKEVCKQCIDSYPESGNKQKNLKWMIEKMKEIDSFLNHDKTLYKSIVLVSLAQLIMSDLLTIIKTKSKIDLLLPLVEATDGLSDQIDPNGDQFEAYEEAEKNIQGIYKILEFYI